MDGLQWSDDLVDEAMATCAAVAVALAALGVQGELLLSGGASLRGALTKGDIDLHLRVRPSSFEAVLTRLGTVYPTTSPQAWADSLAVFGVPGPRPTSIAVTPLGSEHDERFTRTWRALSASPDLLAEYNELKATADPDDYERSKSEFFTRISR